MRIGIELAPGLISDDTSFSQQGSYRDANNVRFVNGRPEVIKGWEKTTSNLLSGACRTILSWKDNNARPHIAFGTHSDLLVYKSGSLYDITPAGYVKGNINGATGQGFGTGSYGKGPYGQISAVSVDYGPRIWTLVNFGESLIATPRLGEIYWWRNDVGVPATKVSDEPGAVAVPVKNNIVLVTKQRQVLSFGCNEEFSGVYNPLCIRGSDIGGNLQDWAVTAANNAFEEILPSGGSIVGAKLFGDYVVVWTQNSLYVGAFIGDPGQTYRFDAVDGAVGLLGPNAVSIVGQTAFWISPDLQVWSCGVGGVPELVMCPIRDDTLGHLAELQGDKVVVSYVPSANELRIDYPDSRDGLENSRYLSLSLADGAWSKGVQSRTAFERGLAFVNPLGVQTFVRDLVHPSEVVDTATAQGALDAIVAAKNLGENRVVQTSATGVSNTAISWGQSGWGLSYAGSGSLMSGVLSGLGVDVGYRVSISFRAKIISGPNVSANVVFDRSTTDIVNTVTITPQDQLFVVENLTAASTTDVVKIEMTPASGTVVEVTDLKVEFRNSSTAWSPARNDGNLFASHYKWLTTTVYPQTVGECYFHEKGNSADGGPLDWHLETNDFALDENETAMLVRGFIPDFKDQQGDVLLSVFLRMYPQDNERVLGPFTVKATDRQKDFMGTGKIARLKLSGSSAPASLRMGRPVFDLKPAGRR